MPRTVPLDAYTILGVAPQDDFASIRRAWQALVRANHPDATGDVAASTAALTRINEAWEAMCWHHPGPAARARASSGSGNDAGEPRIGRAAGH